MSGPPRHRPPFAIFAVVVLLIIGGAVILAITESVSPLIGGIAGMNLSAIALYGYDKWAAVRSRLRVPESLLHLVALLGGSPAALLSQRVFRHKTAKRSFRIWFWLIVGVQVAVVATALWWQQHPNAGMHQGAR